MKILHVITSLNTGGAEKLMVDLLPRLRDLGNEVELLIFDGTRTSFYNELEQNGIKIHHLSIGGNVYNPINIFKLTKYLKHYDIIHTHNTACQYFVPFAKIISFAKCKLVTTEHNTSNRRRKYNLFRSIDRWMYHRYKKVICISDQAEINLKQFIKTYDSNFCTIYNGVNISRFENANPSNEIMSKFEGLHTSIMVAGFRDQKDQPTLIKAYTHLPKDYHLILVGDGVRRTEFETLVAELNLQDRVHLLGLRTDIPELLKAANVVVMSSHFEGLSLSNIEGMASGNPFVASDVDGLREITSGYGVLFPHEDDKALAYIIQQLTTDEEYRQSVIEKCQQRAKQYDINVMVKAYLKVYQELH
jgi:glycosyltransferase involved in cell wall biosynthesis